MGKIAKFFWEVWNILKEFHEHHAFWVYCVTAVPTIFTGAWAWLAHYDALAVFLIGLAVATLMTLLGSSVIVAKNWAMRIGPDDPPNIEDDSLWSARQVIQYMADETEWAERLRAQRFREDEVPGGMVRDPRLYAAKEFSAQAEKGRIRAYGISPQTHQHEAIDKTHWMSFELDTFSALMPETKGSARSQTTMVGMLGGFYGNDGYTVVKIQASDVHVAWPRRKPV